MKLLEPLIIEVLPAWKLEEEDNHTVSEREKYVSLDIHDYGLKCRRPSGPPTLHHRKLKSY
jgi:hypothetical protein